MTNTEILNSAPKYSPAEYIRDKPPEYNSVGKEEFKTRLNGNPIHTGFIPTPQPIRNTYLPRYTPKPYASYYNTLSTEQPTTI